ncbi:MAG: hypothetical protein JW720_00670 [Sedimentisphaerales bacterium]|nr:hypothetical protein [Sedimentisphaerales bacterium]
MSFITTGIMANLITPERIGVTGLSMLWLLPLSLSIAVVYKATKVKEIRAVNFIRESVVLFGSIVVFMAVIALALFALAWLVT